MTKYEKIIGSHGNEEDLISIRWILKLLSHVTPIVNKAFGSLRYDMKMSIYPISYQVTHLEDSVKKTEGSM